MKKCKLCQNTISDNEEYCTICKIKIFYDENYEKSPHKNKKEDQNKVLEKIHPSSSNKDIER